MSNGRSPTDMKTASKPPSPMASPHNCLLAFVWGWKVTLRSLAHNLHLFLSFLKLSESNTGSSCTFCFQYCYMSSALSLVTVDMNRETVTASWSHSVVPESFPILSKNCSQCRSVTKLFSDLSEYYSLTWVLFPRSNWAECQAGGHWPLQPQNCPCSRKRVLASLCCTCSPLTTPPTHPNISLNCEFQFWRNGDAEMGNGKNILHIAALARPGWS